MKNKSRIVFAGICKHEVYVRAGVSFRRENRELFQSVSEIFEASYWKNNGLSGKSVLNRSTKVTINIVSLAVAFIFISLIGPRSHGRQLLRTYQRVHDAFRRMSLGRPAGTDEIRRQSQSTSGSGFTPLRRSAAVVPSSRVST